jgi:hypothetical protein
VVQLGRTRGNDFSKRFRVKMRTNSRTASSTDFELVECDQIQREAVMKSSGP